MPSCRLWGWIVSVRWWKRWVVLRMLFQYRFWHIFSPRLIFKNGPVSRVSSSLPITEACREESMKDRRTVVQSFLQFEGDLRPEECETVVHFETFSSRLSFHAFCSSFHFHSFFPFPSSFHSHSRLFFLTILEFLSFLDVSIFSRQPGRKFTNMYFDVSFPNFSSWIFHIPAFSWNVTFE